MVSEDKKNVKLNQDKYRFAKHLKNRIETKRGQPFHSTSSSNSPKGRVKKLSRNNFFVRQKNFSKRSIDCDKFRLGLSDYIENNSNKFCKINSMRNSFRLTNDFTNSSDEFETDKSYLEASNIVVKTDVEPVFF